MMAAEKRTEQGRKNKKEYIAGYDKAAYDKVLVRLKKGIREEYKEAAESLGLSLNALFITAVDEYIANKKK